MYLNVSPPLRLASTNTRIALTHSSKLSGVTWAASRTMKESVSTHLTRDVVSCWPRSWPSVRLYWLTSGWFSWALELTGVDLLVSRSSLPTLKKIQITGIQMRHDRSLKTWGLWLWLYFQMLHTNKMYFWCSRTKLVYMWYWTHVTEGVSLTVHIQYTLCLIVHHAGILYICEDVCVCVGVRVRVQVLTTSHPLLATSTSVVERGILVLLCSL